MMSKPAVQKVTAAVSQRMRRSSEPRMAIQAAAGAIPRANPRTRCENDVNRLVNEYVKMTARATGARRKHNVLSSYAARMNSSDEAATKPQLKPVESNPAGMWRVLV